MKARVVVQMHGGTISGVHVENTELELDVVFTERPDEKENVDLEFYVGDGCLVGELIYTREQSTPITEHDFDAVFAAADERDMAK